MITSTIVSFNLEYFDAEFVFLDNRSAILALLMSMVSEKQPIALRFAALYCFQVCSMLLFGNYITHKISISMYYVP